MNPSQFSIQEIKSIIQDCYNRVSDLAPVSDQLQLLHNQLQESDLADILDQVSLDRTSKELEVLLSSTSFTLTLKVPLHPNPLSKVRQVLLRFLSEEDLSLKSANQLLREQNLPFEVLQITNSTESISVVFQQLHSKETYELKVLILFE